MPKYLETILKRFQSLTPCDVISQRNHVIQAMFTIVRYLMFLSLSALQVRLSSFSETMREFKNFIAILRNLHVVYGRHVT